MFNWMKWRLYTVKYKNKITTFKDSLSNIKYINKLHSISCIVKCSMDYQDDVYIVKQNKIIALKGHSSNLL